MNAALATFFCLVAVATASGWGGHGGWGGGGWGGHGGLGAWGGAGAWGGHGGAWNPAAHIASGSVSVGANGAVVAGPAGSVRTDNGLHGHGAGVNVAGPAGDVRTQAGSVVLSGPGNGHGDDGSWDDGSWDDGSWGGHDGGHGGAWGGWGHGHGHGW